MMILADEKLSNADWTKQTWDLPIHSRDDLLAWLKDRGISIEHFKTLPIYKMNRDRFDWLKNL